MYSETTPKSIQIVPGARSAKENGISLIRLRRSVAFVAFLYLGRASVPLPPPTPKRVHSCAKSP
jgi:hypothetical protein